MCIQFQYMKTIKETSTKSRGRVEVGREVGLAGVGWRDGEKMQTIKINKIYLFRIKIKKIKNGLEQKEEISIKPEENEETRIQKREEMLKNLWDNFQCPNIWIIGVPE